MKFDPIENILVIGAGGTGSFFLQHLARFIKGYSLDINVTIIDGDIIESNRNLLRSPLLSISDMGNYKAETMATRLNILYGLKSFNFYNFFLDESYFEDPDHFHYAGLIASFVDNMKIRHYISDYYKNLFFDSQYIDNNPEFFKFWLDSGNEKNFGQVFLGYSNKNIPSVQWPNFSKSKDTKKNTSCSIAPFEKQGALTNDQAAIGAMLLLEPLLLKQKYIYKSYFFNTFGAKLIKST